MNIKGKHYRTVWVSGDGKAVEIIDQTKLPFKFEVVALTSAEMAATAIQEMWVPWRSAYWCRCSLWHRAGNESRCQ